MKATRVTPASAARVGDDVGQVQQRDVDRRRDLVGDLVERRGAQQQEVRPAALDAAPGLRQQGADLVPPLGVLELGQLGEVDGAHHQPGRGQPAQPLLHAEVEVAVVDRAALPAHAADQPDRLHPARHALTLPRARSRWTLCCAACARGRITSSSMFTWEGRVAIQVIASATSSAVSGFGTPRVDRLRLLPVPLEPDQRELVGLDHARRDLADPHRLVPELEPERLGDHLGAVLGGGVAGRRPRRRSGRPSSRR